MVLDGYMPGKCGSVCHDNIVANVAIMGYVAVCHEKVGIAYGGFSVTGDGPQMDRSEFTDRIPVADPETGFFTLVLQILGDSPHRTEMKDLIVFTYFSPSLDYGTGADLGSASYFYIFIDNGKWAYFNIDIKLGTRVHNG
jgi:hypothetical protein